MTGQQIAGSAGKQDAPSPARFTTRHAPVSEQFEAWREFRSSSVDISLIERAEPGFLLDHVSWDLGGVLLEQTHLPSTALRRWRHIPKSFMDHWCLVLARNTKMTSRWASGPARDLSFRSLILPFEGQGADEDVLTLFLPRDLFRKEAKILDNAHEAILNTGPGAILADYLTSLARELPTVSQQHLPGLRTATCAIVAACLAPTLDRAADAEKPITAALRERARRIVAQNMAEADFGPDALARLMFVSRSKLYRVFESSGGVARFIQQERLKEAHDLLAHARPGTPIGTIATNVGFSDHSAFSRAFKLEYGYSPSEAREMALAENLLNASPVQPPSSNRDPAS
ncbi:helix-turn-helix transcriptional regulator [Microvirga flavescens]|uniref:helix-turn-helix transcriptional regulator n=1 Tax=Microvirga flavescens TaxID=2249811 RepID=UPI000DD6389D|nr:helix-turn-helix transcriptional regulator [Microvirga flavescens]